MFNKLSFSLRRFYQILREHSDERAALLDEVDRLHYERKLLDESHADFLSALRRIAQNCEYTDDEGVEALRLRLDLIASIAKFPHRRERPKRS